MIHGKFIGINRHADDAAGDLIGAVRDATALWALFSDTFKGADIKTELITDENATVAALRDAIHGALTGAGPDDIVFVSFAGHGTKNHRLVAHDTSVGQLEQTSIGMDELAKWFRESKAQAVIRPADVPAAPKNTSLDRPVPG